MSFSVSTAVVPDTGYSQPTGTYSSDPCNGINIQSIYDRYCSASLNPLLTADCSDDYACCTLTYSIYSLEESCISAHATFTCPGEYIFGTQHGDQCTSSPSFPSFTESVNATLFSQPTTSATATEGGTLPSVTPKPTSAASITITTQSTALGTAAATKSSAGKVVVKLRTSVTVALGAMLAMLFFHTGL